MEKKSFSNDFYTFEKITENQDSLYRESGGTLKKTPIVKKWDKIGAGKSGVYAIDDFIDNETIEECPVIITSKAEFIGTALIDHIFKIGEDSYAFALGFGSLYNHRNQSNARWYYDEDKNKIVFKASRPIEKGEEIYISYGKDYWKSRGVNMKGELNKSKNKNGNLS